MTKTKIKQWLQDHQTHAFYIFIIGSALIIWLVGYPNALEAVANSIGIKANQTTNLMQVVEAKEVVKEVKEPTIEEWVMNEIKKAGLNEKEAWAIIQCESKFNPEAMNINTNKSYDAGIWQINSIHKLKISEALDYKTATKWAIEKRLRDGSWDAWVCSKLINL